MRRKAHSNRFKRMRASLRAIDINPRECKYAPPLPCVGKFIKEPVLDPKTGEATGKFKILYRSNPQVEIVSGGRRLYKQMKATMRRLAA